MRIVCPSCAATYDVPDTRLASIRVVRCARCEEEWSPSGAPAPPAQADQPPAAQAGQPASPPAQALQALADPPASAPATSGPAAAKPRWRPEWRFARMALPAAWAASILLLICLAWASYAWRAGVMAGWPPSERVYGALGIQKGR